MITNKFIDPSGEVIRANISFKYRGYDISISNLITPNEILEVAVFGPKGFEKYGFNSVADAIETINNITSIVFFEKLQNGELYG